MRARRIRAARYASRARTRNRSVTQYTSGRTVNTTRARRQSIQSITPTMPNRVAISPKTATTPEVMSSLSASTSLVILVTRRPTGVLEKNAIGNS